LGSGAPGRIRAGRRAGGDDRAHQSQSGRSHHLARHPVKTQRAIDGADPRHAGEFRAHIDADLARWAPVIAAANIKIN
jgi:hypothetical protein